MADPRLLEYLRKVREGQLSEATEPTQPIGDLGPPAEIAPPLDRFQDEMQTGLQAQAETPPVSGGSFMDQFMSRPSMEQLAPETIVPSAPAPSLEAPKPLETPPSPTPASPLTPDSVNPKVMDYLQQLQQPDQALLDAQSKAAEQRKLAGIMEGVEQMSRGIAGSKYTPGAYDTMRKEAGQPVTDLLAQRKAQSNKATLATKLYEMKHGKPIDPYQAKVLEQGEQKLKYQKEQADATRGLKTQQREQDVGFREEELGLKKEQAAARKITASEKSYDSVRKKVNNNRGVGAAAKTVVRDFKEALKMFGDRWEGVLPSATRKAQSVIPGTDMYDINQLIESAKSNIGIDKLLEIKASGAGLGQVPQSQLETLQSVLGRMNLARDPKLLKRDIEEAVKTYEKVIQRTENENASLSAKYPEFSKSLGINGSDQKGPSVGSVEDGHEFLGGDPGDPTNWKKVE